MRLGTFIPIFVAFIVVLFGTLISAAIKSDKKKQKAQNARRDNVSARFDGINNNGFVSSDPFRREEPIVANAPLKSYFKPSTNFETVEGTDLVEVKPKVHTSAEVVGVTKSHHEEHCAVEHEDEDLYIVEKVPVSGSIEGESNEGCGEHYNLRFVKLAEEEQSKVKFELTHEAVRRAIILGEVLNDPAYKK